MMEGIKTVVLRRYLLSLRFRGLSRRFYGNYYFRWKILPGWWTKNFPCRHCRRIAIKLLMGEKPPDLSPFYFFFFYCFLESRGNFENYFVRAAQLAFRNKKYKLTYLIRLLFLNFAIVSQRSILFLYFAKNTHYYSTLISSKTAIKIVRFLNPFYFDFYC